MTIDRDRTRGLTFEDRVHRLSVQLAAHPDEEQLFGAFRHVVHYELLVGRDRLDALVDRFTFHLDADHVHLGSVRFRHPQEANPVAVAHPPSVDRGDLVVQPEPVANLHGAERKTWRIDLIRAGAT